MPNPFEQAKEIISEMNNIKDAVSRIDVNEPTGTDQIAIISVNTNYGFITSDQMSATTLEIIKKQILKVLQEKKRASNRELRVLKDRLNHLMANSPAFSPAAEEEVVTLEDPNE